ncbi:TRAPP I complex [Acaromyces ingoldii]|uniref:TRAPP I complex n=1 Tax=Acaromyces ingoldii TaxID=215250 RepID=A0A316YFL1_9BASI|nr:TRAPP I complex [Acaromyces ingoldii]PWN88340.1 TRAPP I complex [Acaromyces ingoldii]
MAYSAQGGPQQTVSSPTSSATYPLSPRSSVPSYIRRSSAVSSILGGNSRDSAVPGGSASVRNSTLPSTPTTASSSTGASSYFGGGSSSTTVGPSSGPPDILDRPRDRSKNSEVASSALTFLYAEIVAYTQGRVTGISDLERKLSLMGYRVGQRMVPMLVHRNEFPTPPSLSSGSSIYGRQPKRETRLLPVLLWLHTHLWKAIFGRPADSLERSTERSDEYMISTNTPFFARSMSVPKEMSQLCVEAFTAGIVEAALDGLGFVGHFSFHLAGTRREKLAYLAS